LKVVLSISPAVLLFGARQVGKSTLCLSLENEDNFTERAAALNDPIGYISTLPKPITLDEILFYHLGMRHIRDMLYR